MRIRYPFAGGFILLFLLAAYLGLGSLQIPQVDAKILHFITFFLLTVTFYWIFDTTRRRILNLTLLFVTVCLGLGSEGLQGVVTTRQFDLFVVVANILGSLAALALCTVYHKRMLDRRRRAKGYSTVQMEGEDLELGGQETGVVEGVGEEGTDGEGRQAPNSGVVGEMTDGDK
ncbi:MAG: hypothetical protein Q9163_001064 [Psora crenata]